MNIFVELENTSPTAYTDYVDAKAANAVKPEGNQVERGNPMPLIRQQWRLNAYQARMQPHLRFAQ